MIDDRRRDVFAEHLADHAFVRAFGDRPVEGDEKRRQDRGAVDVDQIDPVQRVAVERDRRGGVQDDDQRAGRDPGRRRELGNGETHQERDQNDQRDIEPRPAAGDELAAHELIHHAQVGEDAGIASVRRVDEVAERLRGRTDDQRVAVCERAQRRIVEMQRVDERDALEERGRIDGGSGARRGAARTAEVDRLLTLERQHQQRVVAVERHALVTEACAPGVHGAEGRAEIGRGRLRRQRGVDGGHVIGLIALGDDQRLPEYQSSRRIDRRRPERVRRVRELRWRKLDRCQSGRGGGDAERQDRRLGAHSGGEGRIVTRVGRRLEEIDVERDDFGPCAVQPRQQLAVQSSRPRELTQTRMLRIVRCVHRRLVDRDQAKVLVLVVTIRKSDRRERQPERNTQDAEAPYPHGLHLSSERARCSGDRACRS